MKSWILPAELDQRLPRRVKMKGSFKLGIAFLTIGFLGFGLLILYIPYNSSHDQAILKATGEAVPAQITNLQVEHGKGSRVYYLVGYRFQIKDISNSRLLIQTATRQTTEDQYKGLRMGNIVPILFDPKYPSRSDLNFNDVLHTSDPYGLMPLAIAMIVSFFGGPYAFLMCLFLFPYFKQKKLIQWGCATAAIIINEETIVTRSPSVTATFQFTDARGEIIQGLQKNLPSDEPLKSTITDNPTALYDPQSSNKNMLYPSTNLICYLS